MNDFLDRKPLPSGIEGPGPVEQLVYNILQTLPPELATLLSTIYVGVRDFLVTFGWWLVGIIIFSIVIYAVLRNLKKKRNTVEKLWKLTLFFLSKRQMTIPLIYTLAKRDGLLNEDQLQQLLTIRNECRGVSLRHTPDERMEHEQVISKTLYSYFSTLESEGRIQPGSPIERIAKDLEFIDEKLGQLQTTYNAEAEKWNQKTSGIFMPLFRMLKLGPFIPFAPSQ